MPIDFSLLKPINADVIGSYQQGTQVAQANLQNALAQRNLLEQEKRKNALSDILASSGGDPNKAIPALLQGGFTQEAASLHAMVPKPAEGFSLTPGGARYDASGRLIAQLPTAPKEETPADRLARERFVWEQRKAKAEQDKGISGQGKAPMGYRFTADGALEPIPGGPADLKSQMLQQQKSAATEQALISSQQVLDQAETLFKHPGRQAATGASSFLSKIPGTEAKGFQSNLDTFKAQTFIPMVSALKGMGALSDAEGKKLSESVGALNPDMPEAEFETSLKKITKTLYDKAKAAGLNVSLPEFAMQEQPKGTALPPDIDALLKKHGGK